MLTAEVVPPEGARYAATLVLVPGLWAGPSAWRRCAGFFAHRGWECHLVDVRAIAGGVLPRAAAVAAYARDLDGRAVLVGHDAGAWVAARAARPANAAAAALVAPLLPGGAAARAIAFDLRILWALTAGRRVPPPGASARLWRETPDGAAAAVETAPDDAAAVRDVLWGRLGAPGPLGVPAVVLGGARDPLLAPDAATALAGALGADVALLPDAGHWPLGPRFFQATAGAVHRWVVQRLGAPLLELYPDAMAAREAEDGDEP